MSLSPSNPNGLPMVRDLESSRRIYLTFDDGPHPECTPRILDVLRLWRIKASFFVVGTRLKRAELAKMVASAASEGHTVGNHTSTHPDLAMCSDDRIREEICGTRLQLQALGIRPTVFRPPFGSRNQRVTEIARELGYELVLWNNDPRDWKSNCRCEHEWVGNAVESVDRKNARVILCHDTHLRTAEYLNSLISALSNRGFAFSNL